MSNLDFDCEAAGGGGGLGTGLQMGVGWPDGINNAADIVQNHLDRPVLITCGFLTGHRLRMYITFHNPNNLRINLDEAEEDEVRSVVVAEQVSSVLMLPRAEIVKIRGDAERDTLDAEYLHLHVTEIRRRHDGELRWNDAQNRYNQVLQAVARLRTLLPYNLTDGLRDSIQLFLEVWNNPDDVRTGVLRHRLNGLEEQLAAMYDEYSVTDDIVQFLTAEYSPAYVPTSSMMMLASQEGEPPPPALIAPPRPAIQADIPEWLDEAENPANPTPHGQPAAPGPRAITPGRLYLRVVVSLDDDEIPIHIYPLFKHGKFGGGVRSESKRLGSGYTDLPPRDANGHRLVSVFCAVSGPFPDGIYYERGFSNLLVNAGFNNERGLGGQSEWHQFNKITNQGRFEELLNAVEILENYADESNVSFGHRNILEQLELRFGTE